MALGSLDFPEGLLILPAAALNDSQRRAIHFGLLDVHRRLAEMESLLAQGQNTSPLSQYVNDLSPTEGQVVRDYFERLRARMAACLTEAGIAPDTRRTGLRWALQVNLTALHLAIAELEPKRLRGCGPLSDAGASIAVKAREDVERLIVRVEAYLRQGLGHDLPQRLARLEASPGPGSDTGVLAAVDRVITRRGLVEFRQPLDTLVGRLETPRFEVAVFGRVSSGKSSLLNHLAGADVLPVGVTPVTAVPTRLVRGERPGAVISFAELPPRTVPVEELHAYASEEGNPGNRKHVTGILVQLPSPRLREGVVLVDTPGIGSLALSGSAETFAYLPRCDLGIVLVDAASTLTPDDLGLLRLLSESAVPAQVVLSKADLLTPADRQQAAEYVREQLRRELGLDLAVHPVSTVGTDEALLAQWFEQEIEPLLVRHHALAEGSLRRKIAHLRETVSATLQALLASRSGHEGQATSDITAVRRLLEEADQAVRQARQRCLEWTADVPGLLERLLGEAARAVVASDGAGHPILAVAQRVLAERDQMAHGLADRLRQILVLALEGLRQTAPDTRVEETPLRDLVFRGLPVPDLAPLVGWSVAPPPWWARLLPPLAAWAMRRRLGQQLGPGLRELMDLHDRQLQAWLRPVLAQLTDLYETQAEMFRELVRRLATGTEGGSDEDVRQLEADLRELEAAAGPGEADPKRAKR